MQSNKVLRFLGPIFLLTHLLIRNILTEPTVFGEIYIYNAVAVISIFSIVRSPKFTDLITKALSMSAISFWLLGSIISSSQSFYSISNSAQITSNICYLLFYPFAIIALTRLISQSRKIKVLEIFDASIFGLGLSTLGATFLLKPVLPHFDGNLPTTLFAITYPIADLILISVAISAVAIQRFSIRSIFLISGVIFFALSDFLYLWMSVNGSYYFGSLVDDGWLVGILLISESFWRIGSDSKDERNINPVLIALSIFLSATLLALMALRPGYFPTFILLPTISTLLLAFIRMTIALRQARNIGEERILARTDELTGLPNRRSLISELANFAEKDGALLLLDLDGFKPINDSYGHEAGDKVLQQVASRFSRSLPHGAFLARLGGDEFGVLLEGNPASILEVALALRATVSYPFEIRNEKVSVGVSIGYVTNDGSSDLLRRADLAMYHAKREGLGVWASKN